MARNTGLSSALAHRDFRWLLASFLLLDIGCWAYYVALAAWVYDATGSVTWIAIVTACRFVPALLFSPYGGVLADRYEKVRVMVVSCALFASLITLMGFIMVTDGPTWTVLVLAGTCTSIGMIHGPAGAAMTPMIVPERQLAAANALRNTIDNLTVVIGPALGGILLVTASAEAVVWTTAGFGFLSALCVSRVRTRTTPIDVTEGGNQSTWDQMLVGFRAIVGSPTVLALLSFSVIATLLQGVDSVLFVAVSDQILGTGSEGYGYLMVGLGIGGLLAAPVVARAEGLRSLTPALTLGMTVYCLPTLVLLVTSTPAIAFATQVVRGTGTVVVGVLTLTALQRALPHDVFARVFATYSAILLLGILIGSTMISWVIGGAGVHAALWTTGAGIFAISLLGIPGLRRMDHETQARREALAVPIALLEACDLFERVPEGGLMQLASASEHVHVAAGSPVITQGEPADAFYVTVSGRLGVTGISPAGAPFTAPDLGPGDYFGEIGLIERTERTATVSAVEDVELLRIDGAAFMDVLTAGAPSAAILDGAALRLHRTHGQSLSRAGLVHE